MDSELLNRWMPGTLSTAVGLYALFRRHELGEYGEALNRGIFGLDVHAHQYKVAMVFAGILLIGIGLATILGLIRFG